MVIFQSYVKLPEGIYVGATNNVIFSHDHLFSERGVACLLQELRRHALSDLTTFSDHIPSHDILVA